MALTGLFLCTFLIVHLAGNLSLYAGDGGQSFNAYTKFMTTNSLIRIMEIVLLLGFVIHIIDAIMLTRKNRAARPVDYAVSKSDENSTWFSRNMGITGTLFLAFLIIHLRGFWFEYHYGATPMDAWGNKDMYIIVVKSYQQWWYSAIYVVAMVVLAAHLNHGFQAAFNSLGLSNKAYTPMLKTIGTLFAIVMGVGFISFPVLFYFGVVGN